MKVIFLQDIARTGRKHEVKDVPDGHAQNYLIPRKLAVPATAQNLKRQSERKTRIEAEEGAQAKSFAAFLARTDAAPVVITVSANEQGHLFKGLRATDIARALSDAAGCAIAASAIALERPIKEVGEYPVVVKVGEKQRTVTIAVNATQP